VQYATEAAENGWGDKCYEYIELFQKKFSDHLEVSHTIATSSCTGALHMGLSGLGIGKGDEVIIGDTNWIASVAPVVHVGAIPVFVDVQEDSWCIDPDKIEAAITKKTKAIIAVHLYGNLCDLDRILAIGKKYGIHVIEDAAEAIGSVYRGKKAGSMGIFSTFSFHGTKTITTGEGGMFATSDTELYNKVLTLSNHGRAKGQNKQFWPDMLGFKYKISNVQAAIGCAQMERIQELINRKREIFYYYQKSLSDLPLKMNPESVGFANGFWMPSIVADKGVDFDNDGLLDAFKQNNIDGRVFFWPLSMLPMFNEVPQNVTSYDLYKRAINLPSYHDLQQHEMDRVVEVIKQFIK
jgi:perosamine synthetase